MASTLPSTSSCCNPCGDADITIISGIGMLSGEGSPEGRVTGTMSGQIYTDTLTGALYQFIGTVNVNTGWSGNPEGNVLRFGADPTGVNNSATAFTNAFSVMSTLRLPLLVPPGTYRAGANLAMGDIPYVTAYGAVLQDLKPVMNGTHQGWFGGKFTRLADLTGTEIFGITGTDIRLQDVTIDYSAMTGNVLTDAYTAVEINGATRVHIENLDIDMKGRSGMTVLWGSQINIDNIRTKGLDDGIVLKATSGDTTDVNISNVVAEDHANIFSIGTQVIGTVRNVNVSNITGINVVSAVWLKPTTGLVENITITGVTCRDLLGSRYQRAIYFTGGSGAIIRNILVENVCVVARCAATSVARCFVHFFPVAITMQNITLRGCRFRDTELGADPGTNGFPIIYGVLIESQGASLVTNILFDDILVDGSGGAAYIDDPGVGSTINNIRLHRWRCRNNVTSTGNAAILANIANLYIDDNLVIETALTVPIKAAAGLSIQSQRTTSRIRDLSGATAGEVPVFTAQRKTWISRVWIVVSTSIFQSDANYTTLAIYNAVAGLTMVSFTTQVTGGSQITQHIPKTFQTDVLANAQSFVDANNEVRLNKTNTGAGQNLLDALIIIDYVQYGTV